MSRLKTVARNPGPCHQVLVSSISRFISISHTQIKNELRGLVGSTQSSFTLNEVLRVYVDIILLFFESVESNFSVVVCIAVAVDCDNFFEIGNGVAFFAQVSIDGPADVI